MHMSVYPHTDGGFVDCNALLLVLLTRLRLLLQALGDASGGGVGATRQGCGLLLVLQCPAGWEKRVRGGSAFLGNHGQKQLSDAAHSEDGKPGPCYTVGRWLSLLCVLLQCGMSVL